MPDAFPLFLILYFGHNVRYSNLLNADSSIATLLFEWFVSVLLLCDSWTMNRLRFAKSRILRTFTR